MFEKHFAIAVFNQLVDEVILNLTFTFNQVSVRNILSHNIINIININYILLKVMPIGSSGEFP